MLLNAVRTGRNPTSHELRAGGRTVGWIRSGLVGFGGFSSRAEAQAAGRAAAAVLDAWYSARKQSIDRHAPASWGDSPCDEDLLRVGDVVVGRLVPPGSSGEEGGESHRFELVMPAAWHAVMLQIAQRINAALSELRTVHHLA